LARFLNHRLFTSFSFKGEEGGGVQVVKEPGHIKDHPFLLHVQACVICILLERAYFLHLHFFPKEGRRNEMSRKSAFKAGLRPSVSKVVLFICSFIRLALAGLG
jgi:hypothetical protein